MTVLVVAKNSQQFLVIGMPQLGLAWNNLESQKGSCEKFHFTIFCDFEKKSEKFQP